MTGPAAIEARLRRAVRGLDAAPSPQEAREHLHEWGRPSSREAAVLVPFVRRDRGLSVLFTRRAAHLRHHPGQVSFPGGGLEAVDAGPIDAALRETREETGIDADRIEPFGYLDCVPTVSGYCVSPVTAFVRGDFVAVPDAREVDEVFEVPFDYILQPTTLRRERLRWQGRDHVIHAFDWQGHRIWGVTAAILKNLLDRMERT